MASIVRASRMKDSAMVVRVTSDVKQAAWLAETGDEVFVLMKVGEDVAREMMARRNVKSLVLDMFVGTWGMVI